MVRFEPYALSPEAMERASRLRSEIAGNQMLISCYRLGLLLRKQNFDPNEPRVPAGNGHASGTWTGWGGGAGGSGSQTGSGHGGATRIAASSDPLKQRPGSGTSAQVSSAANDIATGRRTDLSMVFGTGLESAAVQVNRDQNARVTVDVKTNLGSIRGTGAVSSEPGRVTISSLALSAPGLSALSIDRAPTQISIFDSPDGTLRMQGNDQLTISLKLLGKTVRTLVDLPPDRTIIIPDR